VGRRKTAYLFDGCAQVYSVDEMSESDSRLLKAARRGDETSFLELYRRHRTPLFRFAWRLTGSVATAEDVLQECFLALLQGARFDARNGSLRQYLFGVTRNLALRGVRLAERECEETEDAVADPGPLEDLLSAERGEAVARAVGALPPPQREALILFEYEELSLEEIAGVTGVETGAVKARLYRAREALRRRLAPLMSTESERKLR
jgi:RNA polymerase sigma-70 factor (ECF subfamily)